MDSNRAAQELAVIRELMERPIRYSTQSGLSGIWAGCMALLGCFADWSISERFAERDPHRAFWLNMGVWAGVFVLAFLGSTVLTRMRERRQDMPFWSSVKRRILLTILPPFAAGVGLTLVIAGRWYTSTGPDSWGLIPAIWMLFYGVALWQLGEFSHVELRVLGVAFIAAGLVAAAFLQIRPYMALGVTFGGFHIAYGAIVWARHGG